MQCPTLVSVLQAIRRDIFSFFKTGVLFISLAEIIGSKIAKFVTKCESADN